MERFSFVHAQSDGHTILTASNLGLGVKNHVQHGFHLSLRKIGRISKRIWLASVLHLMAAWAQDQALIDVGRCQPMHSTEGKSSLGAFRPSIRGKKEKKKNWCHLGHVPATSEICSTKRCVKKKQFLPPPMKNNFLQSWFKVVKKILFVHKSFLPYNEKNDKHGKFNSFSCNRGRSYGLYFIHRNVDLSL